MIDYVEIRDTSTDLIGVIDTANSVIWHAVYFGVGDFEIYTQATPDAISLLKVGYYVTRPNDIEVGIIEKIEIINNTESGPMITASGRFAKSILDRRLIYKLSGTVNKATILRGNVETSIRSLVKSNAIACSFDAKRNIAILELGEAAGFSAVIVDENGAAAQKQVSYENLLSYTDEVLKEYGLASVVVLDTERKKLQYIIYGGIDRSINNASNNDPVVFSQEFDNLNESGYMYDTAPEKNTALIGGEGEGTARFYALLTGSQKDLKRREIFVDASSINKAYEDENGEEKTFTNAEYTALLKAQGRQEIAPLVTVESFSGTIDIINGNYVLNRDFSLGDIVTVEDNYIGVGVDVRILEITEVQDENGYTVEAKYQS